MNNPTKGVGLQLALCLGTVEDLLRIFEAMVCNERRQHPQEMARASLSTAQLGGMAFFCADAWRSEYVLGRHRPVGICLVVFLWKMAAMAVLQLISHNALAEESKVPIAATTSLHSENAHVRFWSASEQERVGKRLSFASFTGGSPFAPFDTPYQSVLFERGICDLLLRHQVVMG